MKKNLKSKMFVAGFLLGLSIIFNPTSADAFEPDERSISEGSDEMSIAAFLTGVKLNGPTTIYGVSNRPKMSMSFSGDKNGKGEYRYQWYASKGLIARSGNTVHYTVPIDYQYKLHSSQNVVTYNTSVSATGYSTAGDTKNITHRRYR